MDGNRIDTYVENIVTMTMLTKKMRPPGIGAKKVGFRGFYGANFIGFSILR